MYLALVVMPSVSCFHKVLYNSGLRLIKRDKDTTFYFASKLRDILEKKRV